MTMEIGLRDNYGKGYFNKNLYPFSKFIEYPALPDPNKILPKELIRKFNRSIDKKFEKD